MPRLSDPVKVRSIAEIWEGRRRSAVDASQIGAYDNLREWAATMNAQTSMLIAELQEYDPEQWNRLARVAEMTRKGMSVIDPNLVAAYRAHADAFAQIPTEAEQLWDALEELCTHAATMVSNAKFRVNHIDRTQVR